MSLSEDPITLEVVCEGLIAIVREMRASIIRSSYSPAIYELDDFSCALFNSKSELVAQSEDHPGHVIPMPSSVRSAMDEFSNEIYPGDIILMNDSYRGGTHLNDVTLLFPVFEKDNLLLLPAVRSHWADVGGMVPGSYSGLATNIFQEGLRMPPIKIYERGVLNEGVLTLIKANMRLPEHRMGDLRAMIGACRIAETRIRDVIEKYSDSTVIACIVSNLNRCERRMRDRITALPDGTYYYEDYLEYFDEEKFDPVLMRLALTVEGDKIIADFDGSNPQVPGVVNSSHAVTSAGVFVAVKSVLDPDGAINDGVFRAIEVHTPKKSIVDVKFDAPAGAHGEVRKRAVSVTLGALAQIVPELVSGDLCGTSFPNSIGGTDNTRNRPYVYYEVPAGGNGGFMESDGSSAFVNVDFGNIRSIHNVEHLENEMPLHVQRCVLRKDSGGAGRSRGGLGMQREIRLLDYDATYSVLSDRAVIPPFGTAGGKSALPVSVTIRNALGEQSLSIPGKATGRKINKGDVVIMRSAGGGGYGSPLERDVDLVVNDVMVGYVSREAAEDDYGVAIDDTGQVDSDRTILLREKQIDELVPLIVKEDEADPYRGIRGRHRIVRLSHKTCQKLGLVSNDLVELIGKTPVPLRAWVKIDAELSESIIPLDDFARRVLRVSHSDNVKLRVLSCVIRPC
tara:strand:+ start:35 stop:2071 length:2037 start_codon:yes stop_codon:yes gene_type:complete